MSVIVPAYRPGPGIGRVISSLDAQTMPAEEFELIDRNLPRLSLGRYAAVIGTIEPRKNVPRMLDAWFALNDAERADWQLILAGPVGWEQEQTIERIRQGGTSVRYLGYVPESDLPGLFRAAGLFIYP